MNPGKFKNDTLPRYRSALEDLIRRSLSTILLPETAVDLLAISKTETDTTKAIEVTWQTMSE
jgi:hypothetical protein